MTDMPAVADDVVDALAVAVAAAIPLLKSRIPPVPAAELGRTAAPPAPSTVRWPRASEPLLAERFLGALELTIPELDMTGAPDLSSSLPPPGVGSRSAGVGRRLTPGQPASAAAPARAARAAHPMRPAQAAQSAAQELRSAQRAAVPDPGQAARGKVAGPLPVRGGVAVTRVGEGQAMGAASLVDQFRPGTKDLVTALTRRLSAHPSVAPLLAVPPQAATEETIAAAHGAAHLALAVAVGLAAVGEGPAIRAAGFSRDAAAVGLGVEAARAVLSDIPMPESYAAAVLAKARAEYRLPRGGSGKVRVAGHRFALAEGAFPVTDHGDAEVGNGLVTATPGGVVIRTGRDSGDVHVMVRVLAEEPPLETDSWDEVVEVTWHAAGGLASVIGPQGPQGPQGPVGRAGAARRGRPGEDRLRQAATPPWPGDYRLRVHARGRDGEEDTETYLLEVWEAPLAPEVRHKLTDRLGHRLRGEPEPERRTAPEHAYRWISRSELSMAATITVVTGSTAAEVLRAFGADPDDPESLRDLETEALENVSPGLSVAVDERVGAVLAVENNGYQGTIGDILARASAGGRAASMYWNVNGVTRLSFAEDGEILLSYEPFGPPYGMESQGVGPAVMAALDGLNFADVRDKHEKGLVAVERFTGRGITPADLERIRSADVGYRVQ